MRILLLEDDPQTAAAVETGLVREGHEVCTAVGVEMALELIDGAGFDAAVLDVMVPGGSGFDVLDALRRAQPSTPALMLTARGAIEDRVTGLDRGADDYLVKPFAFAELAARVRALERRKHPEPTTLGTGRLALDVVRRRAQVDDVVLDLTQTEFGLLAELLRGAGHPVTRRELLREVWGYDFDPGTNVVDVHVNRLRRKLEDAGLPDSIRTVRGLGYAAD